VHRQSHQPGVRSCPGPTATEYLLNAVKITSSASIASLLAPEPTSPSAADAHIQLPVARSRDAEESSPSSNHSAQIAAQRLAAATSSDLGSVEAGPRRADQPRMRSSIACARCRRSKVKCVNNGVNTTCRDCEAKGRECTYPTPAAGGHHPGVARRESSISRVVNESGTSGEVCSASSFGY
jgi:ribosomal protein L37AE/L43A